MAENHQALLERLLQGSDTVALGQFVAILAHAPDFHGVKLNARQAEAALAVLGAMGKQVKTRKVGNQFFLDSQENFWALMKHSGVGLSPRHALAKRAAGLGLGVFLAHSAQDWSEKDQLAFTKILEALPLNVVVKLNDQWKADPLMKSLAAGRKDQLMDKVLLAKTSDDYTVKIMREGKSWTTQEADRYLEKRMWPDWQEAPSTKKLNVATSPTYAKDNIPLVLKISAQAWKKTVFAGGYTRSAYKLLEEIDHKLHRLGVKLDLDLPDISDGWENKYLDGMASGHEVARGTSRIDAFLLRKTNSSQVEKFRQNPSIDWKVIKRIGLANITKPSELYIHNGLVEALAEKLEGKPQTSPPELDYDASVQIVLDTHWLSAVPQKQLNEALGHWPGKVLLRGAGKPLKHDYHVHMSSVLYKRLEELDGQSTTHGPLVHAFWFHFLGAAKHNCRRVAKLAVEITQHSPDSLLWDVRDTPEGFEPLNASKIGAIGVRGKPNLQGISAMKIVLLTLTMAINGTLPQANQVRARPKM